MELNSEIHGRIKTKKRSLEDESGHHHTSCKCCCKCTSAIATKGVAFLLVWHIAFRMLRAFLTGYYTLKVQKNHNNNIAWNVYYALSFIFPFAGWIADAQTGRYAAIVCGTIITVIAGLISLARFITIRIIPDAAVVPNLLLHAFNCINFLGMAAFFANFIPFTTDQLVGANSADLSSLVHWINWEISLGEFIMSIAQLSLLPITPIKTYPWFYGPVYGVFAVALGFLLTVLVVDLFYGKEWLVTQPNLTNPIKQIFKVLNYARKNKCPRNRSAFTYIDEEQPTRLDFANTKFGGPFTEEQVEDVKTTLRLLPLIVSMNLIFLVKSTHIYLARNMQLTENFRRLYKLLQNNLFLDSVVALVAIPVYNFIILPLFNKYIPTMLKRIGIAMCILILGVFSIAVIDLVGDVTGLGTNNNTVCLLNQTSIDDRAPAIGQVSRWILVIIPSLMVSLGILMLKITSLEFTLAQSPAGMKGLLFGLWYAAKGIGNLISFNLPFAFIEIPSHFIPGCEFYYLLTMLVISIVVFVLFLVTSRWYKLRMRQRTININLIIEEHYERYLDQEEEYLKEAGVTDSYDKRHGLDKQCY